MNWLAPLTAESHLEARLRIIRRFGYRNVRPLADAGGRPVGMTPERVARLREMLAAGWTLRRIRDELHVGYARLQELLERAR